MDILKTLSLSRSLELDMLWQTALVCVCFSVFTKRKRMAVVGGRAGEGRVEWTGRVEEEEGGGE